MTDRPAEDAGARAEENLRAVRESMLEGLSQLADYFGHSQVIGQLYGALLLSPEPLSLDDLKDQLQISKASVSTNLRILETLGAVHPVYIRGDRRKYYEADADFWRVARRALRSRELHDVERAVNVLDKNTRRLRKGMGEMSEENRQLAAFYLERISTLQDVFRLAQMLLRLLLARDDTPDWREVSAHIEGDEEA